MNDGMTGNAVKVRMTGSSAVIAPWSWACPCCLNYPGMTGYLDAADAADAARDHAAMFHPDFDTFLEQIEGSNDDRL